MLFKGSMEARVHFPSGILFRPRQYVSGGRRGSSPEVQRGILKPCMKSGMLKWVRRTVSLLAFAASVARPQFIGSHACKVCHAAKFESQSKSGHARALAHAPSGSADA